MAMIQRISPEGAPSSSERHVLVKLGDKEALEREGESFVFTVDRKLPRNLLEAHVQRVISDATLMADQEDIEVVLVCFDPQSSAT